MPQFDTSLYLPQVVWLGLFFFIFVAVVHFLLLPRFEKIFHERKKKLHELYEKTNHFVTLTKELQEKDNHLLEQARLKAQNDIKKTIEGVRVSQEIHKKKIDQHIQQSIREAEVKIKASLKEAMDEAKDLQKTIEEEIKKKIKTLH